MFMLINMHTYKSLKLFLIIPAVIIISIAAGISVKAAFTLNISTSVANSDTQINLNWTSVADSVYYKVARDNTVIKIINVDTERNFLSYSDTDLMPETTYNYTVTAVNSDGEVIQTASKSATTTQMKAPSIVSYYVDLNKKSVTLNWINNSKAVRETSVIKVNDGVIANLPDDGTSITFIDPSLEANKSVKYQLVSGDGKGHNSPHSSAITVTPVELPTITAALDNNQIKISWGPNADIEKFVLERSVYSENSWGPWTTIVSNIKKNSTYAIDSSAGDGTYRYRLSINTETFRGYSNISNPVTRILSPKNLQCVPVNARRIDLSWTNPQGWDYKLKVERRKASSKNYTVLSVLDSNISSYSDTDNIELNTGYYYRITAFNEKGISASSSEYYIYTGPPAAAHSLSADIVSSSKVILYWNDNSDNELGFIIERKSGSEGFTKIAEVPANVTTYTDGTLSADKTYTYRVIPYNPYGNAKSYTKELTLSTSLLKDSPASLTATAISTNEIELTWTYTELGNYATAIERKSGSNGSWEIIALLPVGFTSYNDIALTDNNQYYYRVKAVLKEDVYSKPYPNNDTGVAAHTKLKAPQNLKASWSSADTIRLTWLDKSYGAEYFVIERKIGDGSFVVIDTISADEGNTWYDNLLKPGSSYTYRLKSIKGDHSSDYSDEVTVEGYAIPAPSNLKAVILSESKIMLTWEDNSDNETNFIIEQKTGSSTAWKQIGSVKSNITSFTVDKLKPDVKYIFRVKSYNSTHFLSAESEECEVLIQNLAAPSGLSAKAISSSAITLEWRDNSSGEQGFIIERKTGKNEFKEIARTGPNIEKYTDNSVEAGKEYYYRVMAFSESLYTDYTNTSSAVTQAIKPFEDLNSVPWAKSPIEYLAARGIIKGKSANPNLFAPNDKITRAEFISLVVAGFKFEKTPVGTFEDVKPEHWFYKNVMIAKNMGIVSGIGNNLFYPYEPIKREDIAVILARVLKISGNPLPENDISILDKYSDRDDISDYALISMALLNGEKIINGKSSTILAPKDYATRAEAAVILYNILTNYNMSGT